MHKCFFHKNHLWKNHVQTGQFNSPAVSSRQLLHYRCMKNHTILELRTSRSSKEPFEAAQSFFASIPKLKQGLFPTLLRQTESLSFEILVWDQSIYFLCIAPNRLSNYITGLLQTSYPNIVITPLTDDPLEHFAQNKESTQYADEQSSFFSFGEFHLKAGNSFPLKDFGDFKDVDPLGNILTTLSKAEGFDRIAIQLSLGKQENPRQKKQVEGEDGKNLETKKDLQKAYYCSLRVAVSSESKTRSGLLLETAAAGLQILSSERNALLVRQALLASRFRWHLLRRKVALGNKILLSISEMATLFHLPHEKLQHVPNIAWGKNLLGEAPQDLPVINKNTSAQDKKDINVFARAQHKNAQVVYGLKRPDRRRHFYVIGKTGTGKSTLLANMAINDLKNDEGLCVIDPHGDLVDILLDYIPKRRINDVVYFDPSDTARTVKINLFEGKNVEHRELIASGIVSIFQKLYSYSWGPRLEHILRNALLTLLKSETSKMSDIVELLTNKKFREKIIDQLDDDILKNFWKNEFGKMQDRQRSEAVAPILNKVGQFVSSPLVRNVVNASKSSFSIEEIMSEGKILLVNLSQGKLGEDNATLLGAMLITKIQLAAMGRVNIPEEERKDFFLYVDEFQNFATDSFIKILSEARKYRLNLVLANQYIAQIPEEVQKAIFGNCGSMASFVMGADDAESFEKEYGGKYSKEDLTSLNRYQIINRISIDNILSSAFPAYTLPLAKSSNQNREKVIKVSRERYATKR